MPTGGIRAEWDGGVITVSGGALPELLAIAPIDALTLGGELVPTSGSWERDGVIARFVPRFPTTARTVFAVLSRRDASESWSEQVRVTAPGTLPMATTVVESIDPQCESVPANLLRLTVTFSNTMDEGTAAGRITLRDANGAELLGMLLEMPPELWDRDRRRLTVLFEPGRIKRGLQPNKQAGSPLREGETVTVVVGAGIRDAAGAELAAAAQRSYRVGSAVRSRVDPKTWKVQWPKREGDPLVVRFDRPLDRTLVRRCLRVVDGRSQRVTGGSSLDESAAVWVFTGEHQNPGTWRLRVDTRLEDLAGNSVRRTFDRDLAEPDERSIDASFVTLDRDAGVELTP